MSKFSLISVFLKVSIAGKGGESYPYDAMIDTQHNNLQICEFLESRS